MEIINETNLERFVKGILYYGNATLYKVSSVNNPMNIGIKFYLDEEDNCISEKIITLFDDPFFTVEGVNNKVTKKGEINCGEMDTIKAISSVILSDGKEGVVLVDDSEIDLKLNDKTRDFLKRVIIMLNWNYNIVEKMVMDKNVGIFDDDVLNYFSNITVSKELLDYINSLTSAEMIDIIREKSLLVNSVKYNSQSKKLELKWII